jgi:hypothetical protein
MEFSLLFFLLGFALAGNVKHAVFNCNFNVILSHFGQVGLEQILVVVFDDIDQGRPIGHLEPVTVFGKTKRERWKTAKERLQSVLKFLHLPKRVPSVECLHIVFLSVEEWPPDLPIALTINCDSLFKYCAPSRRAARQRKKRRSFHKTCTVQVSPKGL